jgi:thiamine pyrophosphokinase
MKRWVLFLPGPYRKQDVKFYRKLCAKATLAAVDGGCSFFTAGGLTPNFVIGDMDSVKSIPRRIRESADVIRFPVNKDKTDLQLAVEYALDHKASRIDIVNPDVGQVDHFLGNLMLLGLFNKRLKAKGNPKIRIVNIDYEILWLHDTRRSFVNCVDDRVSVLPISASIKLTCRGAEYAANGLQVKRGYTRSLRNRITARRASVEVRGEALVVHYFSKRHSLS